MCIRDRDYLDNCIDYFEDKKQIILALDTDAPGLALRTEFVRRLGAEACFLVDFEDCKDANEYLIKYGKEKLKQALVSTARVISEDFRDKNSKGDKLSLDLLLTPNVVLELGVDDNNIQKKDNFAKLSFVFPPREGPAASTEFIADEAFPGGDMSSQLLSKVKRSNKITLESEGVGVTISRLD